jgi:vacuolar-type H+-ATPase subunit I/STV1
VLTRFNEWAREHPWQSAAVTALFLFVFLTIFGIVVFDRGAGFEATVAAAYAVTFSLLTGAVKSYRNRRDGN